MSDNFLTIGYDAQSLAAIARLQDLEPYLNAEMAIAMDEIGTMLMVTAIVNTWKVFANPTGDLADTIHPVTISPLEIEVGSDSPYAARREFGFMGKTDALGRGPFNDPAKPYLDPALTENEDQIMVIMNNAAAEAIANMGVPV